MILTGSEIARQVGLGNITLDPFSFDLVNPNSYNYRLGPTIKIFDGSDEEGAPTFEDMEIPKEGYILRPGRMYLGHTMEVIGSSIYAMSLIGRSSIGRLGLFVQVSANLGHTRSCHQWTLELVCVKPIRLYPGIRIGQVSFWCNQGQISPYDGYYGRHNMPTESQVRIHSRGGPQHRWP